MEEREELEKLRKKYFPRIPWTAEGPVRRVYLARAAEGTASVCQVLMELALREGFIEPGGPAVLGGAEECLAAFRRKAAGGPGGMIFGTEEAAHWCDAAAGAPDSDGWQRLIVRSEEGENLTALAHGEGLLRFRRAE